MKELQIYDYYSFGYNYYILLNDSEEFTNLRFYTELKTYFDFIERFDLKVTKSSLRLNNLYDDLSEYERLSKNKKGKGLPVDKVKIKNICTKLQKIDNTLDAELNTINAFMLEEKRFSLSHLMIDMGKLFSANTFTKLPVIAKYDFKECGKCLAFDRYTASAFHALRGTEDVLKFYYSLLLNKKARESQTWYSFVKEIEREVSSGSIKPEPSKELLINLESLRKYYRNKTQHPQLIYTLDEVQDLISNCTKSCNQIINDLLVRKLII